MQKRCCFLLIHKYYFGSLICIFYFLSSVFNLPRPGIKCHPHAFFFNPFHGILVKTLKIPSCSSQICPLGCIITGLKFKKTLRFWIIRENRPLPLISDDHPKSKLTWDSRNVFHTHSLLFQNFQCPQIYPLPPHRSQHARFIPQSGKGGSESGKRY